LAYVALQMNQKSLMERLSLNMEGRVVFKKVKGRGFTLVELMITLAILAILMTVAVPNFGLFVQTGRMDTIQNRLVASLAQARSEAIRRGGDVTVTFTVSASGGRVTQWLSKDEDGDSIRQESGSDANVSLTLPADQTTVVFTRDGELSSASNVCFVVDDGDNATDVRYVQLNAVGRARAWDGEANDAVCGSGS
uniref:GspH/FimT family pseudopilin n=1 Tax=Pontibacterium sp. TaxID=2036026 RepID=UPI003566B080